MYKHIITLHEYARTFTWNIMSREVRDAEGLLVMTGAFNIKQARAGARHSLNRR